MLRNIYIFRRAGGEGRTRGGGDRRSIDEDPTVRVEPVGLGLMCDYNIIIGRGGIAGDVIASGGASVMSRESGLPMRRS